MEDVERRTPGFIHRYHLSVNDRVVGQIRKCPDDGRIPRAEIVIIPRPKLHLGLGFGAEGAIAIELN